MHISSQRMIAKQFVDLLGLFWLSYTTRVIFVELDTNPSPVKLG